MGTDRMIPHRVVGTSQPDARPSVISKIDRELTETLRLLGQTPRFSPMAGLVVGGGSAVLLAARVVGLAGAIVAVVGVACSPWVLFQLASRRRERSIQDHLPDVCIDIARSIRSGDQVAAAVLQAGKGGPTSEHASRFVDHVARGRPLLDSLRHWAASSSTSSEEVLATALVIGVDGGGRMGDSLDHMAEALRRELATERRVRTLTTQSRYSARVLTGLPILFAVGNAVLRGGSTYQGLVGAIALVTGTLLSALGLWWMNAIIGRLQ